MSQETNEFLNNECMKAIKELADKHPNDMDLGKAVRSFLNSTKVNLALTNQLTINFFGGDEELIDDSEEHF